MKPIYQSRFEEEFLSSDKLRVQILFVVFLMGFIYALINFTTLKPEVTEEVRISLKTSLIFLFCITLFEFSAIYFVSSQIRRKVPIPMWHQYANAFVEISSPTVLMILLARNLTAPYVVVSTPLISLYFLFIVLSTLRIDYRISLFIAIVGSLEYFILGQFLLQGRSLETIDELANSHLSTNAKALGILFCGLGATFVARQIRNKINNLLEGAAKESRIVNLFGQQISKEIVKEMLARDGKIPGKLMRVCVMFIDIRNFTSFVVGKSPEEVVDYQNAFFSVVIEVVTRHGGIINQFLGDGCMVTFGAPAYIEKSCACAVQSAIQIREELDRKTNLDLITPTQIGVGIHVGEAVTGNIGTDVRQQYSITGSVVIIAARIEQLNKEFNSQILISEDVLNELTGLTLQAESLGQVVLKGWNEPVSIYKLV